MVVVVVVVGVVMVVCMVVVVVVVRMVVVMVLPILVSSCGHQKCSRSSVTGDARHTDGSIVCLSPSRTLLRDKNELSVSLPSPDPN
ncbi:hypothetical protein FHG87_019495 [Trinorchestia longiramus]|nr:hypothetical protein FHG87_019495 [Trinorchestia longiramus]